MLSQLLTERVEYQFQGRKWALVFTHRALLQCEQMTGLDILSTNLSRPSTSFLRALLFVSLKAAGAECTIEQIGNQFKPSTLRQIKETIVKAWIASMYDPHRKLPIKTSDPADDVKPADKPTWLRKWAYETSLDGLNISEERWLDMTPRQVQELQIVKLTRLQREEYLIGILAAQIENFSAVHPKEATSPDRFMIHKFPDDEELDGAHVGDRIARYYSQFPATGDMGPAPSVIQTNIIGPIPEAHLNSQSVN